MTRNAKDLVGICSSCNEWTTVHDACCSRGVIVEGGLIDPCDYCEFCGEEFTSTAECEHCKEEK